MHFSHALLLVFSMRNGHKTSDLALKCAERRGNRLLNVSIQLGDVCAGGKHLASWFPHLFRVFKSLGAVESEPKHAQKARNRLFGARKNSRKAWRRPDSCSFCLEHVCGDSYRCRIGLLQLLEKCSERNRAFG